MRTVLSTNPSTIVGGQPLGNEFCEVVVNVVMKKDALLPWTYGDMLTVASADRMNIAWPFNKIKECKNREGKNASSTPQGHYRKCGAQQVFGLSSWKMVLHNLMDVLLVFHSYCVRQPYYYISNTNYYILLAGVHSCNLLLDNVVCKTRLYA